MRALPGRQVRASGSRPAAVTRSSAHLDQRRRILRAVAELVAKRGYGDVTVELIVKRARVSYKTFYKHFSNKEDCFIALFDRTLELTEERVRKEVDAVPRPWAEQVSVALRTIVEMIVEAPLVARAVVVEAPTAGPAMRERHEAAIETLVPLLAAGRELNPRGHELPATIERTLAGSAFWSVYQRLIVGEVERLPEILPEVTELILRTYLGQEEAQRVARDQPARQPAAA